MTHARALRRSPRRFPAPPSLMTASPTLSYQPRDTQGAMLTIGARGFGLPKANFALRYTMDQIRTLHRGVIYHFIVRWNHYDALNRPDGKLINFRYVYWLVS